MTRATVVDISLFILKIVELNELILKCIQFGGLR